MLKFNEQKQIESVNGALALRNQINELIDGICKEGYGIKGHGRRRI